MRLTSNKIIELLVEDSEKRQKLLDQFVGLNEDDRLKTQRFLWDLYDQYFQARVAYNLQLTLQKVRKGELELKNDLYDRVYEQTEKEMEQGFNKTSDSAELTAVREKLEKVMQTQTS